MITFRDSAWRAKPALHRSAKDSRQPLGIYQPNEFALHLVLIVWYLRKFCSEFTIEQANQNALEEWKLDSPGDRPISRKILSLKFASSR
jgi:hypothetical protein